ncbi:MAG: FG-GAP repeat protein [Ignavibacteria bacterium]|nr:FG-GAP repeat protein [Ignavibacteria bacterium]
MNFAVKITKALLCILIILNCRYALAQQDIHIPPEEEADALNMNAINGLIASQRFGYSVANCGDLNADGYDDMIAGAHITNSSTGRAYIFFGGTVTKTTPDLVLNGEAVSNSFGLTVAGAGDVNGDGYADVIIGANGYSSNTGRAYIFFGGFNMDNIADVVLTGPGIVNFGYAVSSAGDVNGDGFADVMVSGHTYSSNRGRAYLFYGGIMMDNTIDKTFEGLATGGFFSFSLAGAGDVNGDGFADILIGAYAMTASTGSSYLYYGGASMDSIADVTFTGEASNNFFGQMTASAGDVNGDGYSDFLIGAPLYSTSRGRAYLYYGGPVVNNSADVIFTGESSTNSFGRGLCGAGDVDGDGFADIVIGAQSYASSKGKAYVYLGGTAMNNTADAVVNGEGTNNFFGLSVAGGGDMNGDGYKDFMVGAYGVNTNKGRVYVYKNSISGTDISDVKMLGTSQSNFGLSATAAGDLNGDGYDDYIVGAPSYGDFATGRAYIFFGSQSPDTIPDITINGHDTLGWFGWSVYGDHDFNADGYDDIVIGAPEYNASRGRIYIYYGGNSMDTIADVILTGAEAGYRYGHSVAFGGDMNGDGYPELLVGAIGAQSNRGYVFLYYGGVPFDTVHEYNYSGASAGDFMGASISHAGDVNGDGYSDVVFGMPGYLSSSGRVYIVFGQSMSLRSINSVVSNGGFGSDVSGAGDVNKDGFSDFIVGAPYADRGEAYIYYGGVNPDYLPDVTFYGEESQLGYTVSGAGDVNNDGYDDVIVGEREYGANYQGRVYMYFGSTVMDNSHDILINSNFTYERIGENVSGAGDINGDGIDDVLVSTPANETYGSSTGAAYLHLSMPPSVKPNLISVKDVPNDQGGKVNLKWARSAYDASGAVTITSYLVQRSLPPGGTGFFWENIVTIPATRESYYAYTDNTPFDSISGNSGTLYYRITALTVDQNVLWRSNIVYGRSIDNLAPSMVQLFGAEDISGDIRLTWKRNSESDLLNYILYRSSSPVFDIGTATLLSQLTDSLFTDNSPPSGLNYYFIFAQDIHNNLSEVASTESPNMTLNLTMFIEGFYNAGSNSQVSDTILAELRNSASPFAVADQTSAVVSANGTVQLKFGNAENGSYYIAVKHRSSIETWSAGTIALSRTTPANYNISTSSSQAFGSNMIQVDTSPIRFAIYGGDVNQDGTVDATDVSTIDNDASNFISGYVVTDLTGDEFVDGTDFAIADNNAANFVSAITP